MSLVLEEQQEASVAGELMGDEAREVTGTEHAVGTLSLAQSGWQPPGWEPLGSVHICNRI